MAADPKYVNLLEIDEEAIIERSISPSVASKLPLLDKLLPLWILLSMIVGILLSFIPNIQQVFMFLQINNISLPIALGLLWMMFPVLAKVKYEELGNIFRMENAFKQFGTSLVLNWLVGPLLLTTLAWICLPDLPEYRTGIILVGLARCIAMVLIWNMLAGGNSEFCATLVALNSVFQIFMYSPLAYLYLHLIPKIFGASEMDLEVNIAEIALSVLIFLGIPLTAGFLTRYTCLKWKGEGWYNQEFIPRLAPTSLLGLLFTITIMFSLQGHNVLSKITGVARISLPLLLYFALMFSCAFGVSRHLEFSYETSTTQAFTAAGNNFELAIAVAVASFGINSKEALATIVGPLIEVPVLITLVYVSLWLKKKVYKL